MSDDEIQQRLKDAVAEVRKANGWTFQKAWTHLQQTKPELFEGEPFHEQQASAVYRFVDVPALGRSKPLRELLADLPEPTIRVEA